MSLPDPAPNLERLLVHSEWLATLARRLVADRATADDLVQDTWVAALRNPPRETGSLRAWLSTVARRLSRAQPSRRDRELAAVREDGPPTDDVVARIEQERLLAKLVVELEEPYRRVVLQHFYAGRSAVEIARSEGVPDATVRTRVRRALGLLRERLEREDRSAGPGGPLAALCAWTAAKEGAVVMSTKTMVALGVASGALCALTVTEGILPRIESRATPATASLADAGEEAASPVARPGGELASPVAQPIEVASAAMRTPELTPEDLRKMLSSSARVDQVRAIELLMAEGSPAARGILLDAFLSSADPVLLALLEEAFLGSPSAFAPALLEAFAASDDPEKLARLARLLSAFARVAPELERQVLGRLLGAIGDPDAAPGRAEAAMRALVALGASAADELAGFLVDPNSGAKGVGSAAWAIAQLPAESGELVREKLDDGLRSVDLADGVERTEEERDVVLQKTGSIAWAASLRPAAEHDRLSETLLESLLRTRDPAQAGTLAWSLGNLKGLTEGSRTGLARRTLDALRDQTDDALRRQYATVLRKLAADQPAGPRYDELVQMAEDERRLLGNEEGLASFLDRWIAELRAREDR